MDLETFFTELADWSDEFDVPVTTHRYGPHPDQVADLRLPTDTAPKGFVAVVHGGYWRARFTRETTRALCIDLARRGWATWNIEYRRIGSDGGVPGTLDDVALALYTLNELRPCAGFADIPLVLLGHSAGGQLALWAAPRWAAGTPEVVGVVSLGGVCDLTEAARLGVGDGAAAEFVGASLTQRPDRYALADPVRRLPLRIPTLLVHGVEDDRVPLELSKSYAAAAQAVGDPCELLELPGVDHFEVIDPRTSAWSVIAARLDGFATPGRQRTPEIRTPAPGGAPSQ